MTDIIKQLKDSPIFQLSLSSLELFHSNFIKWIIDRDDELVLVKELLQFVGANDIEFTKPEVEREKNHFDLTIILNKSVEIIIEVKVKSFPRLEQLREYQEKHSKKDGVHFILLTLTPLNDLNFMVSKELNKIDQWKELTFNKLADFLTNIRLSDQYHNLLLKDYCSMIVNLSGVVNQVSNNIAQLGYYEPNAGMADGILEDIRIDSLIKKIYFSKLADGFKEIGKDLGISFCDTDFIVDYSLTNNTGLVEIKSVIYDEGNKKALIGIQIQGEQFREFVEYVDGHINIEFAKQLAFASAENHTTSWFNFAPIRSILGEKAISEIKGHSRQKKGVEFAQYSNFGFVYRYVPLKSEHKIKTEELNEIVALYFKQFISNKDQFGKIFRRILESKK